MPRRRAPTDQARIAIFARDELEQLVDDLYTKRNIDVQAPALLGALILAARRLPLEVVQALLPAYVEREREELARGDANADEAED